MQFFVFGNENDVVDEAKHVFALRHMLLVVRMIKRANMRNKQCIHTASHHWRTASQPHRNYGVQERTKTCSCTKEAPILFSHPDSVEHFNDIELRNLRAPAVGLAYKGQLEKQPVPLVRFRRLLMTARGINDALASLDMTVRSRALRYRRSCLLSEVAYNPVVYPLIRNV